MLALFYAPALGSSWSFVYSPSFLFTASATYILRVDGQRPCNGWKLLKWLVFDNITEALRAGYVIHSGSSYPDRQELERGALLSLGLSASPIPGCYNNQGSENSPRVYSAVRPSTYQAAIGSLINLLSIFFRMAAIYYLVHPDHFTGKVLYLSNGIL